MVNGLLQLGKNTCISKAVAKIVKSVLTLVTEEFLQQKIQD